MISKIKIRAIVKKWFPKLDKKKVSNVMLDYAYSKTACHNAISEALDLQHDESYVSGMLYCIQQLVVYADEPTLVGNYIMLESGIPMDEFIMAQKRSGYENRKMLKFIRETFRDV